MAKTFNRTPILQNEPTKSDVKNYTFDNYKFSGFKEDKNFLEIDQYSFAESKNVYVDNDGLLRSRPSIKRSHPFNGREGSDYFRANDVYVINQSNKFVIYYDDSAKLDKYVTVNGIAYAVTSYGSDVYIFGNNRTSNVIWKFNKTIASTDSAYTPEVQEPYIPETEIAADSTITKAESKNILTDKTKTIYLYVSSNYANSLSGKNVSYIAFGQTFTFTFNEYEKRTILKKLSDVGDFSSWDWLFSNGTFFLYRSSGGYVYMMKSYDGVNFIDLGGMHDISILSMSEDGSGVFYKNGISIYYFNFSDMSSTNVYLSGDAISGNVEVCASLLSSGNNHAIQWRIGNSSYSGSIEHGGEIRLYPYVADDVMYCVIVDLDGIYRYRLYDRDTSNIVLESSYSIDFSQETILDIKINYDSFATLSYTYDTEGETWVIYLRTFDSTMRVHEVPFSGQISSGKLYPSYDSFAVGIINQNDSPFGYYSANDPNNSLINWKIPVYSGDYNAPLIIGTSDNDVYLLGNSDGHYEYGDRYDILLTSKINTDNPIKLTVTNNGADTIIKPDQIEQLNEYYFRVGDTLYLSEYRQDADGNLLWYLPENASEKYDGFVTMCPLSSTEMGIFTEEGVHIHYKDSNTGYYSTVKSKLDVKIRKGSDVLGTYDGTSLIVPTVRGLAVMNYQDFVQTTDQKLTFLSDTIYDWFSEYNDGAIKLYKYGHWFVVFKENESAVLLLDTRGASWWPMDLGNIPVKQIIDYNDKPLLIRSDGNCYVLSREIDDYYDYEDDIDGHKKKVDWYLRSQPLYLSAPNYYKHIQNITLMNHLGTNETDYLSVINLRNKTYRSKIHSDSETKCWQYEVEMIRSYVLRLNYPKVCEFEYELSSDNKDDVDPIPLSLSNITVKYKLGGQIR